jgi:DNA-binding transcriptional regulator LsrR (DeoR family)
MGARKQKSVPDLRRQPVDDDLKIRLATERYSVPMPEVRQLAKKYSRAEGVVSRAIISAFKEGLVEIRPKNPKVSLLRRPDLEESLRNRFSTLLRAVVIDAPQGGADTLHVKLGGAFAEEIRLTTYLRHREIIGLGAGRSIYHAAAWLTRSDQKLCREDTTIISLCGDSYPRHDSRCDNIGEDDRGKPDATESAKYHNISLDADSNANLLAQAFQQPVRVAITSRPIFMDETDRPAYRKYFETFWSKHPPSLAIVGVGIVNEAHRLIELCDSSRTEDLFPPILLTATLRSQLFELRKTVFELTKLTGERYSPVAEVCMWLFFVRPRVEKLSAMATGLIETAQQLIADINEGLFAARLRHLAAIPSVAVIAGGIEKARAIWALLNGVDIGSANGRLTIDTLCTDSRCAELLINSLV